MALNVFCTSWWMADTAGWVLGPAAMRAYGSVTGTPTIVAADLGGGTANALEVSAAAATEALELNTNQLGASKNRIRVVMRIRTQTSLPAADTILGAVLAGVNAELVFHQSTGKLAVRNEGSALVDGPTYAADTNYVVELYCDISGTTHTIDWWVNGVAQTQCSTGSLSADTVAGWQWGWSFAAQTHTTRYQDFVAWTDTAAIAGPKGPHKVKFIGVDPAGTIGGTTTSSFKRFTANGTIDGSFVSADIRDAIKEVPGVFGASASGVVQDVSGTGSFLSIPMTTYPLGAGESIAALRMLSAAWDSNATNTNTFGYRYWNGSAETTLIVAADRTADTTATPAWACKECPVPTQGQLDALEFRIGFSGDVSPIPGIHNLFAELAVASPATTPIDATQTITATLSAGTAEDKPVSASQSATATLSAGTAEAKSVSASQAVTATLGAGLTVERSASASQAVTTAQSAAASREAIATASQAITTVATAAVGREAMATATQTITATLSAGTAEDKPVSASQSATATLSAGTAEAKPVSASQAVTTAQSAAASITSGGGGSVLIDAAAVVTATLTAAIGREAAAVATQTLTAVLSAALTKTVAPAALASLTATLSAGLLDVKAAAAAQVVVTTLIAEAFAGGFLAVDIRVRPPHNTWMIGPPRGSWRVGAPSGAWAISAPRG